MTEQGVNGTFLPLQACAMTTDLSFSRGDHDWVSDASACAAVVTAGVTITTGFASARYTGSKVDAARYLCMFGLGGVVVAIYTFLMPT